MGRWCTIASTDSFDDEDERHAASPLVEHPYQCPHCGEPISVTIDLSVPRQVYIEDCTVCCQPIEIDCRATPEGITSFSARAID